MNATNVSDNAAAILMELVSRIAKDGGKGFEPSQIAKKESNAAESCGTGFLSNAHVTCDNAL